MHCAGWSCWCTWERQVDLDFFFFFLLQYEATRTGSLGKIFPLNRAVPCNAHSARFGLSGSLGKCF